MKETDIRQDRVKVKKWTKAGRAMKKQGEDNEKKRDRKRDQ